MGLVEPDAASLRTLPMPIRIALRDVYFAGSSPASTALASLESDLGLPVDLSIDWAPLWAALAPEVHDPELFVARVAAAAAALLDAVRACCDDELWADKLLSKLKDAGKAELNTRISYNEHAEAVVMGWDAGDGCFGLVIPHGHLALWINLRASSLIEDVRACLMSPAAPGPHPSRAVPAPGGGRGAGRAVPARIPPLAFLPPPLALCKGAVPLVVTVREHEQDREGRSWFDVRGSHPATLEALAVYLERHLESPRRRDVRIWRNQSVFGGHLEGVTVHVDRPVGSRPEPVVAFALLGELGYDLGFTDGRVWVFKREVPFES